MIGIVLATAIVGFGLGSLIGYCIGREDGEETVHRYYDERLRKRGLRKTK